MRLLFEKNRGLQVFILVCAVWFVAVNAEAHEKRLVAGKYEFVVGFLEEPAFSGQLNGIDLRVSRHEKQEAMEGLEKTLYAEISRPEEPQTLRIPLRSRYGKPGQYGGYFVPELPGTYIFRIFGEIKGLTIEERFVSGPGRFGDVEDTGKIKFPPNGAVPYEF